MVDLTGQVAIVTGAGRDLGRLYALELARRGAHVVVHDVGGAVDGSDGDTAAAEGVVAEIERAGDVAAASHGGVDTPEGGAAIVGTAVERFGRLDAVVSNAGIFGTRPFDELTVGDWRAMLRVHLDGGFHVSQPAFRVMNAQGHGRFVFVASSAGLFGHLEAAHYAAAKAGLAGLANVIAIEGAPHGIRPTPSCRSAARAWSTRPPATPSRSPRWRRSSTPSHPSWSCRSSSTSPAPSAS